MSEFYLNKLPNTPIVKVRRGTDSRVCGEACLGGAKERCGADVLMRRDVWTVCGAASCLSLYRINV